MKYTHKKFANGLNLFLVNTPDSQSVLFTIMVKVGSRYESEKVAGISHFLEHIFFKGSVNYPKPSDISEIVDTIGGDFNAYTSKEATEFYIKAEKHHFDLVFKVLSDMLLNPLFNEQEIEKEKGVVIEEINMYKDSPASEAENKLEELMWPGNPLGRDIIGTKTTVQGLKREDILEYREAFYQPSNIILGISGNFNQKNILKQVSSTWGKLKNKRTPSFKPTGSVNQRKPGLHVYHKTTEQAHLALGFHSFGYASKQNPAALLLAIILGGNMSSRLFVAIREQKGLAYYISASQSAYHGAGNFCIQAGLRIDQASKAVQEILHELSAVKSIPVTEIELKKAKDFIKGKMALSFENKHKNIDWLMDSFANYGKTKSVEQFQKDIEKVKAEDILSVAKEIFQNERMNLSVVGPFSNKKSFQLKI